MVVAVLGGLPYQLWLIVLTEYLEPYEGLVRLPQAAQKHNNRLRTKVEPALFSFIDGDRCQSR